MNFKVKITFFSNGLKEQFKVDQFGVFGVSLMIYSIGILVVLSGDAMMIGELSKNTRTMIK